MYKKLLIIVVALSSCDARSSDFGVTGLIDIPTARMMEDGNFKVTYSSQKIANILNLTYQATPWLETTFRYTDFSPDNPYDTLKDRSYEAKIKIINEKKIIPQIAVGVRDILGTGAWNTEYLVASKKVNEIDFTLGLGWGRFSNKKGIKNPFILFGDEFKTRGISGGRYGGRSRSSSFFTGQKASYFGGISYDLQQYDIKLLLEYNPDEYLREISLGTLSDSSPISFGLEWSGIPGLSFGLSYQQGNQFGISLSSNINTKILPKRKSITPFFSSTDGRAISNAPSTLNLDSWYDRLLYDMERSGLLLRKAKISQDIQLVDIEISNLSYEFMSDALNQTLTLAEIHLPLSVKNINVIVNENGFRTNLISYQRKSKKALRILESDGIKKPSNYTIYNINKLNFGADLASKFQLFDPDKPIKSQLYLKLTSNISLPSGWILSGVYALDIDNNFDLNRGPNSSLNHVRTDINRYLYEGASGIESLYFEKRDTLTKNLFYRFYGGILEDMYSGLGVEFLYQPFMSRLAYGTTIRYVHQRDYKRNFSLLNYKTTTGFLSLYYASPFYNYDLALHIGKYLAKDIGSTLELRRTFDNGFSVGAFATFTDVSASEFGEGSFDKGLYFKIPFNNFTSLNTKRNFSTIIRSIQRDGGQRLEDYSGRLWHDLRNVRYDNLMNNKQRMLPK